MPVYRKNPHMIRVHDEGTHHFNDVTLAVHQSVNDYEGFRWNLLIQVGPKPN